jgi:hypothetical protein
VRQWATAAGSVALIVLAGCSSSSSSSSATAPSAAPSATASASPAPAITGATEQAVATNWEQFFSGSTPADKKVSLLQNGSQFAPVIQAQASGLGASAGAKVQAVQVTGPTTANVTYDILLGGQTALGGQHGTAVLENGTWKVGTGSFCSLLALEQQTPPGCPGPSASAS